MHKFIWTRLLWIFLAVNPLLDILSGLQIYLLNGGSGMMGSFQIVEMPTVSISMFVRLAMLAGMAVGLLFLRDRLALLAGALVLSAFVLSVGGELLSGKPFALREDVSYIARFALNIASFFAFSHLFVSDSDRFRVDLLFSWTLLAASLGILVPFLCGVGFYTYADPMGLRGCRGLFFSGNDAAALMLLLLPLTLCSLLTAPRLTAPGGLLPLLSASIGLNAMLVLGTKTTFLALGVTLAGVGGWTLVRFFRTKAVRELARFGLFLLASGFLFGLFSLLIGSSLVGSVYGSLTFTGEYIEASGVETALLSGRTTKLLATWREFQAALPQSLLFGLGRGTQATVVEMDLAEIFLYYGLPGGAALCWVYVSQGVLFLRGLFRRLDLRAWCCALSLGLAVGYLCLAGHTLFSVTSGFYFALTLLYARRFTGESPASPKGAIA